MKKALALGMMIFGGGLSASSTMTWLGGTLPYETVSYRELDMEAAYQSIQRSPQLNLEAGLTDHWMIAALGSFPLDAGQRSYLVSSRYRFSEEGNWPLDVAVWIKEAFYDSSGPGVQVLRPGLILAKVLGEHSVSLNASYDSLRGLMGQFGYRSPYFYWATRAGLEWSFGDHENLLTPQLEWMPPGDIAVRLGGSWEKDGGFDGWRLALSYELFPTPHDGP